MDESVRGAENGRRGEKTRMSVPPGIGRKEKGRRIRRRQEWEEGSRGRGIPLLRKWEGRSESVGAVRIENKGVERTRRVLPSTTRRAFLRVEKEKENGRHHEALWCSQARQRASLVHVKKVARRVGARRSGEARSRYVVRKEEILEAPRRPGSLL